MAYEDISAYLNKKESKAVENGYKAMCSYQNLKKKTLYQVNEECNSSHTYEIDTLTEIVDAVKNMKNMTTTVERKFPRETLYLDIGLVKLQRYSSNYLRQMMISLMTTNEEHLSTYEVLDP